MDNIEKRQLKEKDFESFGVLLEKLLQFKSKNDQSNSETDPTKIISKSNDFSFLLTKQEEYLTITNLLVNSSIDYPSKSDALFKEFQNKIVSFCSSSNPGLIDWRSQVKLSPYYLGFRCSVSCVYKSLQRNLTILKETSLKEPKKHLKDLINISIEKHNREWVLRTPFVQRSMTRMFSKLHVTLKFLGDSPMSEEFGKFVENIRVELTISHLVYVKSHLMCLVVQNNNEFQRGLKDARITCSNEIPHITCMTSGCPPKTSNHVLNQINERLKNEGETLFQTKSQRVFSNVRLAEGKFKNAVFLPLPEEISAFSFTSKFYRE
jgi:2'-5' RNA ligase